ADRRVVLDRAGEARVELRALEVGRGLDGLAAGHLVAETDRALHQALVGEDPVEAVDRALFLARVVLERARHGRHDGALRRAVRTVQQDQLVHAPRAHERADDAVDGVLYFLLPHHRRAA